MKKMRKICSMILAVCMLTFTLTACGSSNEEKKEDQTSTGSEQTESEASSDSEQAQDGQENEAEDPTATKHVIAVGMPGYDTAQINLYKSIYESQIADAFNVEFIFSEALNNDIASEMQFMENAKNSGAEGYISYNVSTQEHADNLVAKANDLGLYISYNGTISDDVASLPFLTGSVDPSAAIDTIAEQFKEMTNLLVGDGEKHNVVICTMGASVGSQQHIQSTVAALEALKDVYDLTYDDELENIAKVQSVTEISTGSDIKIKLIPGPRPDVASDVEQALKAGEYDVLICVGPQYSWYESVIKAVEDNLNMDIKTCSIMGISDATATSFHTEDATGHPSLNCALLKNSAIADQLFVLVYNALTGDCESLKIDGKSQIYPNLMWVCDSADTYDELSQVDSTEELVCFSADEMKQLMTVYNADVTADDFLAWCNSAAADSVLTKLGLK